MFHRSNGKQHTSGPVFGSICFDNKSVANVPAYVQNFFAGIDVQVEIEDEVDVMRQHFLSSRFFSHRLERAFMHLDFVGRGEHRTAHGILPDRVRDGGFFDDEIAETSVFGGLSSRKAGRTSADDMRSSILIVKNLLRLWRPAPQVHQPSLLRRARVVP